MVARRGDCLEVEKRGRSVVRTGRRREETREGEGGRVSTANTVPIFQTQLPPVPTTQLARGVGEDDEMATPLEHGCPILPLIHHKTGSTVIPRRQEEQRGGRHLSRDLASTISPCRCMIRRTCVAAPIESGASVGPRGRCQDPQSTRVARSMISMIFCGIGDAQRGRW